MHAQGHRPSQRHINERHFIESGRASQVATCMFVSTDRDGTPVAPAVRMERGNDTAPSARTDKSAASSAGRVLFGLHPFAPHRSPRGARA
ncbi:hypothetical protein [Lysobacter capsici]|uniref:hypothetical protein n=1 Tax=Lysobacter capsici TaxID=435897 RepID=UPI001C000932|nr:hypothetical protein [Lysobacter capsici]QWF18378.1 hypothetical protein KME82_06340 [Lysobacter capsici]